MKNQEEIKLTQIYMLDLTIPTSQGIHHYHPVVVHDATDLVLIDCGTTGSYEYLVQAMIDADLSIRNVTKVIITHHDHDHVGGLGELKRRHSQIQVIASTIDTPYIEQTKKSLRLMQAEALFETLPMDARPSALAYQKVVEAVEAVSVDIKVNDGDVLPVAGGIEIVMTPGHMPGHIAVYLARHKTMVVGDAMVGVGDQLQLANPKYTLDMTEAKKSIQKLLDYDFETLLCYHGGRYDKDVKHTIACLLGEVQSFHDTNE